MIKVGSDFSGVGAFNQALIRLGIEYKEVFACDMDKYARQTFIHNYGEPEYYPTNVYDRAIPTEPLDIYMTSPPCQAFSLAGKRLGKDDKRGILFFNSYEFIQTNKPRYFIFENVKGLLSDDSGKTFSEWVNMLGGKSVNGNTVLFHYEESVPYHIYWQVLNAKEHGVPQNRERVFIIGIRDDEDNNFNFPKEEYLTKRLKDVLEDDVNEKYFLSEKMISWISEHREKRESQNNFPMNENDVGSCVTARYFKMGAEDPYIKIKSATSKGYEEATEVDILKLQECLKRHKNKSIKSIAQELNLKKTQVEHWFRTDKYFAIPNAEIWFDLKKCLNITTSEFDLSIIEFIEKESVFEKGNRVYSTNGIAPTMTATSADERILNDYKIRRLTPRECFRLMDFPDTFTWTVSDSQAYKQAGNSIVVAVLAKIINRLNL